MVIFIPTTLGGRMYILKPSRKHVIVMGLLFFGSVMTEWAYWLIAMIGCGLAAAYLNYRKRLKVYLSNIGEAEQYKMYRRAIEHLTSDMSNDNERFTFYKTDLFGFTILMSITEDGHRYSDENSSTTYLFDIRCNLVRKVEEGVNYEDNFATTDELIRLHERLKYPYQTM